MVLKAPARIALVLLGVVGFALGFHVLQSKGLIPVPGFMAALIPEKTEALKVKDAQETTVAKAPLPSTSEASVEATLVRGAIWEWNAQMGLLFANGGPSTTKGSLMEKHGVNLYLYRQDDTNKMQSELVDCAKEQAGGAKQCSTGANFVVIMGGGSAQFAAQINPLLKKLGPQWQVETIGAVGRSFGEDSWMVPAEVRGNPKALLGLLVEGVIRDDDWNIAQKYEGDNGLKNNPDEKTYDPDAVNWGNAPDYNVAAADYVAGKCEDRKVVKNGHPTGETKHVCVNSVVTWTPGDVTIAHSKRGGLVKLVSSKEYLMPAVVLGPKSFFDTNSKEIHGLLAAAFEGADQVRTYDTALRKGAEVSAAVYNDKDADAAYWYKYYKGVTETDTQGNRVDLGGSKVNNLADNLILFGLTPGVNDTYRSIYLTFARIDVQQYPALYKETPIPDVRDVEDRSFVTGAQAVMTTSGDVADAPTFTEEANAKATKVVSHRAYNINFATGKATLTGDGVRQLYVLKDSLAVGTQYIDLDGYTDNTGDEVRTNQPLSEARAQAVREFLQKVAPGTFTASMLLHVQGHGSQNAVASNGTASGRAANRRVEITTRQ